MQSNGNECGKTKVVMNMEKNHGSENLKKTIPGIACDK
jgi:hypothetical protein